MKTQIIALTIVLLTINGSAIAQEKYAVLIAGDYMATDVPVEDKWNEGIDPGPDGYYEFWNDVFLFWEMLYTQKGFTDEKINVFFAGGNDYYLDYPWVDNRYRPEEYYPDVVSITDYSASKTNVQTVFGDLANTIDDDDFLFVWIMSHGGNTNYAGGGNSYVYLRDYDPVNPTNELLYDYELKDLLDAIPAFKKVVFIQAPHSGDFANELGNENTYVLTSSSVDESSYRADDEDSNNEPFIENEWLEPNYYYHGEFNYHLYSALTGLTPSGDDEYGNNSVPLSSVDTWDDDIISFSESQSWLWIRRSISDETSQFYNYTSMSSLTTLEYPTIITFNIGGDSEYKGLVGIMVKNYLYVDPNVKVTFNNESVINFEGTSYIYFSENSSLQLGDDVSCFGSGMNRFYLSHGNGLSIGKNVLISSKDEDNFQGFNANHVIFVENEIKNLNLNKTGFIIENTQGEVYLIDCNFSNSSVCFEDISVYITNTDFYESNIYLRSSLSSSRFEFYNCSFNGPHWGHYQTQDGIRAEGYDYFKILNCQIQDFNYNGIDLTRCGNSYGDKEIINCSIKNNGDAGISLYNSYANIKDNVSISENEYGICSFDNSNVSITGNKYAVHVSETQNIKENTENQIYTSLESFPYKIKSNAIYDIDTEEPLIKTSIQETEPLNITYNFWGENFDPEHPEDYFFPHGNFDWEPYWILETGLPPKGDDELLFESAQLKIEQQDFSGGKSDYQALVTSYPNSIFAQASFKNLITLERHVNNDYLSLKEYYLTNPSIQSNNLLLKIAGSLANWCDVYSENYQVAIDWFENVIADPPSLEDSVFAIIDLGYVYFLMENGCLKSSYTGKYPQYKFTSREDYSESVDFHLSLLFDDGLSKTMKNNIAQLKTGELLQNVPNPFNGETQIWYKIDNPAEIRINVFDYAGKKIKNYYYGSVESGNHCVNFSADGLSNGIYFYTLNVNGILADSKKMTVLR